MSGVSYLEGRSEYDAGQLVDIGEVRVWVHDTGGGGEPLFLFGGTTAGHFPFDFARPYLTHYRLLALECRVFFF